MEFSFTEGRDCDFITKELHKRFFPVIFNVSLRDFTSILKSITVYFLYTSTVALPKQKKIWLIKQINIFSNQSFRGIFVKFLGQKMSKIYKETVRGGALF